MIMLEVTFQLGVRSFDGVFVIRIIVIIILVTFYSDALVRSKLD